MKEIDLGRNRFSKDRRARKEFLIIQNFVCFFKIPIKYPCVHAILMRVGNILSFAHIDSGSIYSDWMTTCGPVGWKCQWLSHVCLLVTPWTGAHQAPLSMGFSRQEYWSGLSFPSPGDLPDPGIEPWPPALQGDSLPSEPPGKLCSLYHSYVYSGLFTASRPS